MRTECRHPSQVNRFSIIISKKTALVKKEEREVSVLLKQDVVKEEKARIKVEHIIRTDFTLEAYEILSLQCELLHERIALLLSQDTCPSDLEEVVCTLMYCGSRTECTELTEIAKQLRLKYGQEFFERAISNEKGCVNERVVHKLSVQPPTAFITTQYLTNIAQK